MLYGKPGCAGGVGGAVIMEGLALKLCRWPRRAWKVPAVRLVLWGARPESQGAGVCAKDPWP